MIETKPGTARDIFAFTQFKISFHLILIIFIHDGKYVICTCNMKYVHEWCQLHIN